MKGKKWVFIPCDEENVEYLSEQCHITKLVARLLINRGFTNLKAVKEFLFDDTEVLHDPFLLTDMDKACERIRRAIDCKENITVYGDYDVDGVTATSALVTFLKKEGAAVDYYIPDRMKEGYGINQDALEQIKQRKTTLVITVDTGITAHEEVEWAKQNGIDIVITDHHECKGKVPEAVAVINPKRPDSLYPFCDLAGVGVAFKLICALSQNPSQVLEEYCGIVSIGTIADVMPLKGENRYIVKKGLSLLSKNPGVGIRALFFHSGVDYTKKLTSSTIGYTVAPRINAAGRMGCALSAVQLFLTENYKDAVTIAGQLCEENKIRQNKENKIWLEAIDILEQRQPYKKDNKILVLYGENWHNGVIGIVASKLSEKYGRPVVLISFDDHNIGKGSGRSIKGFNLYEALKAMGSHLERFGGHELAAGLTITREKVEVFEEEINRYADKMIKLEDMVPTVVVEGELSEEDISIQTVNDINQLQPFGVGNTVPVFVIKGVEIVDIMAMSNDKHLNFTVQKGDRKISALAFSVSSTQCPFTPGDRVDMIGTIDHNTYRGGDSIQFVIGDMRLSQEQQEQFDADLQIYQAYRENQELTAEQYELLHPDRSCFVDIYRYVKQRSIAGIFQDRVDGLNRKVRRNAKNIRFSYARMMMCLHVLEELKILNYQIKDNIITIHIFEVQGKIELNSSKILKQLTTGAPGGDVGESSKAI